ncbi:MAG TPA: alanine racemase [Candidatus Megaira endosymbiont of Hartmannula sinica]|nr:alanine racemase [Candidatus Megaera endosymbiont of Hartmannula sinica]
MEVSGVIKANAYGIKMEQVFDILYQNGCRNFFVSSLQEALQVKSIYKKYSSKDSDALNIYLLHGIFNKYELCLCREYNIIPVINNLYQLNIIQDIDCLIHIDTGINRLGFKEDIDDLIEILIDKIKNNRINIRCIISHLSCADDKNNSFNRKQLNLFNLARNKIISHKQYFANTKFSLSASGGALLGKEYHFDMVRIGAGLYGINFNSDKLDNKFIKPCIVLLKVPIMNISYLRDGEYVGYSNKFQTKNAIKVATLMLGYGDGGVNRNITGHYLNINGYKARVIGNISMDMIVIDISGYDEYIKGIKHTQDNDTKININDFRLEIGQYLTIINCKKDLMNISSCQNTIDYEFITSLSNRYKRVYIK